MTWWSAREAIFAVSLINVVTSPKPLPMSYCDGYKHQRSHGSQSILVLVQLPDETLTFEKRERRLPLLVGY